MRLNMPRGAGVSKSPRPDPRTPTADTTIKGPSSSRRRTPLSCGPCRERRHKCNHQTPCSSCTKRGDDTACEYDALTAGEVKAAKKAERAEMNARLCRLERLVLFLKCREKGASRMEEWLKEAESSAPRRLVHVGGEEGSSSDVLVPSIERDEDVMEGAGDRGRIDMPEGKFKERELI